LTSSDASTKLPDLFDNVDSIRRFRILLLDIQVKMPTER